VLDERSERTALVTNTNLPFGEWTKVFPEPRLCKAVIDRLTFKATIIEPARSPGDLRRPWKSRWEEVMPANNPIPRPTPFISRP
jgi:DNA replication protein DnaC